MNVTKFFLAALAVIAVAFAIPQAARATGNPAAAPPTATAPAPSPAPATDAADVVDPNAPVKGVDQSLEAPWLAGETKKEAAHKTNDLDNAYVGPVDQGSETAALDTPHRSQGEVADFLVHAITEILSMGVDPTDTKRKKPWTYEEHLQTLSSGMDPTALAQLGAFMEKYNFLPIMQENGLVMRVIVDDQPLLLNKGAVDGSYRWLYELPVTISFLKPGLKSIDNSSEVNRHVIIRMQVGRVPKKKNKEDPGIDEMMIQSFDVRENTDYKHK